MSAQQTIIQQDNTSLVVLVGQFEIAREAWAQAAETWDAAPTIEAHAAALAEAERQSREATTDLAAHVAAWVKAGYRLHLPDQEGG